MVTEHDLELSDGRTLHFYDAGSGDAAGRGEAGGTLAVFWHHGTPNIGSPPAPLFAAAARNRIRWLSHDRPAYGGSMPNPGRNIASAAADVASIADALGIERFAVMGHSGGGAHALACSALLPDRVLAVVSIAGLAPFGADGLDWFAGINASGAAELRAASQGRAALRDRLASGDFDPAMFTPEDQAALEGSWSWFGEVVKPAIEAGPDGMIDDDLAAVSAWGFDPAQVTAPALFVHGGKDRIVPSTHGEWLAARCPSAELRLYPADGHISVLNAGEAALDWLCDRVRCAP